MKVLLLDTSLGENLAFRLALEGNEILWSQPVYYKSEVDEEAVYLGEGIDKLLEERGEKGRVIKIGPDFLPVLHDVDLIVLTDVGMGQTVQKLKDAGFNVIGGGIAEGFELSRSLFRKFCERKGIKVPRFWKFSSSTKALDFIRERKIPCVIKGEGRLQHTDIFSTNICLHWKVAEEILLDMPEDVDLSIEEYIDGWEMAVGAMFNGKDFMEPAVYSCECKHLFPDRSSPLTGEMGTLVFYHTKNTRFFREILQPFADVLRKSRYVGYFDVNCIYRPDTDEIFALEATVRFGYPLQLIRQNLHRESWTDIFSKMVRGERKFSAVTGIPNITGTVAVGVCGNQEGYPYASVMARTNHCVVPNAYEYFLNFELEYPKERSADMFGLYFSDGIAKVSPDMGRIIVYTGLDKNISKALEKALSVREENKIFIPGEFIRKDVAVWETRNFSWDIIAEKLLS